MGARVTESGPFRLARFAADVARTLDELEGRVLPVGHSMGAQVAELAAGLRPGAPHAAEAAADPRGSTAMTHLISTIEDNLAILSLDNPPQNRIGVRFVNDLRHAFHTIERSDHFTFEPGTPGSTDTHGQGDGDDRPARDSGQRARRAEAVE